MNQIWQLWMVNLKKLNKSNIKKDLKLSKTYKKTGNKS